MSIRDTNCYKKSLGKWFSSRGWQPHDFQLDCWNAVFNGLSGLLNAPTGTGKTFAVWLPFLVRNLDKHTHLPGIRVLWITPLRALARDTEMAISQTLSDFGSNWKVARKTGDISAKDRAHLSKNTPEVLITTPESLHLMLSKADYPGLFANLEAIVVDEWHELLGTKRGVQTEVAIHHLRESKPAIQLWGISATIGNIEQGAEALGLGKAPLIIRANIPKKTDIITLLPDKVESFPWAGHIGLKLLPKIIPVVHKSRSTLLFTNTRAMTEIWYQQILEYAPELAGRMAIHHGSLDSAMRTWVESALHEGYLKLVICTSSLDLGVDFAPVETVIQVGSPKGVARFLQRAGRSGHRPGATSTIYFVPTHALEILDSVALRHAVELNLVEHKEPLYKPLDVLVQFVFTLACGVGCDARKLFNQIRKTYTYRDLTLAEWDWVMLFTGSGGKVLQNYNEYQKVHKTENGILHILDRKMVTRHRLSIGTITSDPHLKVKFLKGGTIGTVEESFVSKMKPGDVFLFSGRYLEFVRLKDLTVWVKKSTSTKGMVSRWMGGRMQFSSQLAEHIRLVLGQSDAFMEKYDEMTSIRELLTIQQSRSGLPGRDELLIEQIKTREGWHHFYYPLEGRAIHEALSSLIAWKIGQLFPVSFSIAVNDYGFELLSDQQVPMEILTRNDLFSTENLLHDIHASINSTEMARRQFREIARVSGLTFSGYPGRNPGNKHLQANSSLLFDVFSEYEPDNLLVKQAYEEILRKHLEEGRLHKTMERIQSSSIRISRPQKFTPFAFPIMIDRLRAKMSTEKIEDRIKKMYLSLIKD